MTRPDVILIMTDQERATPPYETDELRAWRNATLTGRKWFADHGVSFERHYTGSLACVPSRPTLFTGQYPDLHGVTQTDGLGKMYDDSRLTLPPVGRSPPTTTTATSTSSPCSATSMRTRSTRTASRGGSAPNPTAPNSPMPVFGAIR